MRTAPTVSESILCPLGQPKKAIGFEPQIESWLAHCVPKLLVAFPRSTAPAFLFPPSQWFQNGPRRQGLLSHSQRRVSAPLAVPLTDSGPF